MHTINSERYPSSNFLLPHSSLYPLPISIEPCVLLIVIPLHGRKLCAGYNGLKVEIIRREYSFFDSCFASKRFVVLVNKVKEKLALKSVKGIRLYQMCDKDISL